MPRYYVVRVKSNVDEYVKKGVVAVGWSTVNFSKCDVETALNQVRERYNSDGNSSNTLIGRKVNEVKRFLSIIKGDYILVPCYKGFYIGISDGNFSYDDKSREIDLSNLLHVSFVKAANGEPLKYARDGKITALSSKLSVRGFTVLEITSPEIIESINDLSSTFNDHSYESIVLSNEGKELLSFRDKLAQVLPNYNMQGTESGGRGFERLIAALFEADGYSAKILSKQTGDGESDADVLAIKHSSLGDEFTTAYYIQAKHHSGITSSRGISQIIGYKNDQQQISTNKFTIKSDNSEVELCNNNIRYVLISSGSFSNNDMLIAEENDIILIDGDRLAEMIYDKIDDLDEYRYKLGFIKKYEHIG